ncbi:MAG: hypothetical protein ACYTFA_13750 [Planctomycetota bacterium]|jgi:hypothetical protein
MLKFFRKYNKVLLAVFMSLLMIVFVGGQALQTLFTPRTNLIVAESNLGSIETNDQQHANATTRVLEAMGLNWRRPMGGRAEPLQLVDWILLTREAERYQAQANLSAVKAWLGDDEGSVDAVARRIRTKPDRIYEALTEFRSVQIVAQAVTGACEPSAAEVRKAARDALDKVEVKAVVLPAEAFADDQANFSEARLEAQLEAHRDAKPEDGLNFGYYVEPTLTAQFIKIDLDAIAERMRVPNHEKKAKRYFNENRETDPAFERPPEQIAEAKAAADLYGPPAPDAEEGEEISPFLTWEEAKEAAMDAVRKQRAEEAAERISTWLCSYDAQRWLDVDRQQDRYKEAPEDVATLEYYDEMIKQIPATIAYTEAVTVMQTGEFFEDNAGEVPEIGAATYRRGRGETEAFGRLAFRSKPIVPTIPDDAGGSYADYLSLYQTCQFSLTDDQGNLYVFRVVGSTPGHPAESVAEVRDRVVADLRLIEGHELAKSWGQTLRYYEDAESLEEAYAVDGELEAVFAEKKGHGGGFFSATPVPRVNRALLNAGIDMAEAYVGGGIGMVPNEVIDNWFTLEDTVDHREVYELPDRATVLVVEWVETQPAGYDEFEEMKGQLAEQIATARVQDVIADWFDPEQIRARNGFELVAER